MDKKIDSKVGTIMGKVVVATVAIAITAIIVIVAAGVCYKLIQIFF